MADLPPTPALYDAYDILDLLPDAMIVVDDDGLILKVNSWSETMFGYRESELLGREMEMLISNQSCISQVGNRQGYFKEPGLRMQEFRRDLSGRRKDGTEFPVECISSPAHVSPGTEVVVITVRDISQHKVFENLLQEQLVLASLRASIGTAVMQSVDLRELLQACAQAIVKHLDAAFARIWTVDESGKYLDLQASTGLYTHMDGDHSRIAIGEYKVGLIASERRPHLTNEVQKDPRVSDKAWAREEGMVAFAGHPLLVGDRLVGVMAMFARHALTESTLTGLASIADYVALAIEHKTKEHSHAQLASIVQLSDDAIVSRNMNGTIMHWNSAAERMFGYSAKEAVGSPISMLLPSDRASELTVIDARLLAGERVELYDTVRQRKDGSLIDVSLTVSPIKDKSGKVIGASAIARDITERKSAAEAEKKLLLMKEREDFMFTLTHDLKNPLIGANRILDQLAQGEFGNIPKEPADVLLRLRNSNTSLIALIQNIIEVYRYEKDTTSLTLMQVNLVQLLAECVNELVLIGNDRSVKIITNTPDTQTIVMADVNSMRRVIHNLAGNAIKFSPEGQTVTFSLYTLGDSIVLDVHNVGETVAIEDQACLFQRFWQGSLGKKYVSGSGLGLYLCHKIVTAHKGTITCCSDDSTGTVFSVKLPVSKVEK